MKNTSIAEHFDLLAKLMEIHGENSFRSKSYANAAFQIERLPHELTEIERNEWSGLRGIGPNIATKVDELIATGHLKVLDDYMSNTPDGVVEMLQIKGLGPKKIHTVWKEMEIETIGELLYACNENRLVLYKGFGEKTQINVRDAIIFMMGQQGKFLYQQAEPFAESYARQIQEVFQDKVSGLTGEMRRREDIISQIDFLICLPVEDMREKMSAIGYDSQQQDSMLLFPVQNAPTLALHSCSPENAGSRLLETTGNKIFLDWISRKAAISYTQKAFATEKAFFDHAGIPYIQPTQRETAVQTEHFNKYAHVVLADPSNVKAIIHCHSQWSDGSNSLEDMAMAAKERGFEYMVISDHSKSAFYAGGQNHERILQQHEDVNNLNRKLTPFKVFKSIECDILSNGQLDYEDDILGSFDLIIASVHSSLKMSEEKAMQRLITAIENPYTIILGHMTGRLLLSRSGYPVDHKKIIDACAANKVVIELNAHPRRLDIDWRWIPYALEKEVLISINPDAHSIDGFSDIRYGCIAAQKALLPAASNLSSFTLIQFEEWLLKLRFEKGTLS